MNRLPACYPWRAQVKAEQKQPGAELVISSSNTMFLQQQEQYQVSDLPRKTLTTKESHLGVTNTGKQGVVLDGGKFTGLRKVGKAALVLSMGCYWINYCRNQGRPKNTQ